MRQFHAGPQRHMHEMRDLRVYQRLLVTEKEGSGGAWR
jgi:hypothetical protein